VTAAFLKQRDRASRFLNDRYAYGAQANYLSEFGAFAVIAAIVIMAANSFVD
jgi:hypothetical protein